MLIFMVWSIIWLVAGALTAIPAIPSLYESVKTAEVGRLDSKSHEHNMMWLYLWVSLIAVAWPIGIFWSVMSVITRRFSPQHRLHLKERQLEIEEQQRKQEHEAYLEAKRELDFFNAKPSERELLDQIRELKVKNRELEVYGRRSW